LLLIKFAGVFCEWQRAAPKSGDITQSKAKQQQQTDGLGGGKS
jgi:hypothetical protein